MTDVVADWGWVIGIVWLGFLVLFGNPFRGRDPKQGPESRRAGSRDAPQLVQLVRARMIPAYDKALGVLLMIREDIKRIQSGEAIAALLQLGVIDPSVASQRAVEDRLSGEVATSLDSLSADLYEKYELIVRWIWSAGDFVGQPFSDSKRFNEWQREDGDFMNRLRDMLGLPEFQASKLHAKVKEIQDGCNSRCLIH